MTYYLGFGSEKPEFARFNYAEKAEYWALVWGLFVMAGTGIMLWAKNVFRKPAAALVVGRGYRYSLL